MKILKEIYETIIHFIRDLRSTRIQLVVLATGIFWFSIIKNVDHITLGIIAGLLTMVYTYYFASTHNQAKHEHEIKMIDVNKDGIDDSEQ